MPVSESIVRLSQRSDACRALLVRWCDQNSGSGHAAGLAAMLDLLETEFRRLPGRIERVSLPNAAAPALRLRVRPEAGIQLLFSGHFDTVYGENDPFQKCESLTADRLRGPGVIDMKGGLVVMLAALEAFEQTPQASRIGYEVLLTPDEEIGSFASAPLFVEAAKRNHFGFVFEPARPNGDLVQSRKGTGNFAITSRGRAAHAASTKQEGRNAIAALGEFVAAASRLPAELPGVLVNVGSIRGGGPATNVVPDFAEALLDVRITHANDSTSLLERLQALAAPINAREGHRIEITGGFNRPAMESSTATEAALASWQQCGRDLGLAPFSWVHAGGASDANNLFSAGLPCLDGLGPIGDRLHSPDEWVHVPSLVQRAQVAALFLHRLAAGEITLPAR